MANVNIRCSHPQGVVLNVHTIVTHTEVRGVLTRRAAVPQYTPVRLAGNGAITPVDSAFWSAWLAENAGSDLVRKSIVHQAA